MTNSPPRPSAPRRGYDRAWSKVRARFLAKHRACVMCGAAASQVDHIVPVRQRPDLRLAETNLRALCGPCHSRRTARDQSGWTKGFGATADGGPRQAGHPWHKERSTRR